MTNDTVSRGRVRWIPAVGGFVIVEVVMIAAAIAWVAFYAHVLHSGQAIEHYEAYAQRASPTVSVVIGLPAFFAAGWRFGRRLGADALPTAIALVGVFLVVDGGMTLAAAGPEDYNWAMVLTKVKAAAALLGARLARPATPRDASVAV